MIFTKAKLIVIQNFMFSHELVEPGVHKFFQTLCNDTEQANWSVIHWLGHIIFFKDWGDFCNF